MVRALSGAVFIAVVLGAVWWRAEAFAVVFAALTAWSLWEFYHIARLDGAKPARYVGVAAGVALFVAAFAFAEGCPVAVFLPVFPLLAAIFIMPLYIKSDTAFSGLAYTLAALLYIAVPFALLNGLVFPPLAHVPGYTPQLLIGVFILSWTNDTFAFLTGVCLGKHRLFERISPKKSWEGFFGGLAFALLASQAVAYFAPILPWYHWLAVAAITVVFGVFGDLVESLLKRNFGLKDSGHFLPGHGGILDRFDSALLAAPMVYAYVAAVGWIG
jgi:phosphatidate cytidylyltransferase